MINNISCIQVGSCRPAAATLAALASLRCQMFLPARIGLHSCRPDLFTLGWPRSQSALIKYEVFTTGRFEMLKAQLEAHVEALISNQASQMLTACGLAQVYTLAQKQPAGASTPLVSLPGCGEEQMVAAFGSFFRVIFSAVSLHPACTCLSRPRSVAAALGQAAGMTGCACGRTRVLRTETT